MDKKRSCLLHTYMRKIAQQRYLFYLVSQVKSHSVNKIDIDNYFVHFTPMRKKTHNRHIYFILFNKFKITL